MRDGSRAAVHCRTAPVVQAPRCRAASGRLKDQAVGWVRRPQIDLLPAEQMRRNPSSIFALPAAAGINRPMGIAALNLRGRAILWLLAPARLGADLISSTEKPGGHS
jgi:hypothetical protein